MLESYQETAEARIESDLASFADPGSVSVIRSGRTLLAEWKMRGEPREATLTVSPDSGIKVNTENETQPYTVFLAGTRMADLRRMAQMIKQAKRQEIFVPTRAHLTDVNTTAPQPATELLTELIERDDADVTQVVMVTGEAGAGKTRVLQELVAQQANRYLQGKTKKLLLYVNAQGRALARLNEALATELQDLKVNLTYHSVATLARVGLLIPVIDGFDEILGVSGYDDAFSSLATFLEQLEGQGELIASARSVYYEEEFISRASHASTLEGQAWFHVPVKIVPWEEKDQQDFLAELAKSESIPEKDLTTLRTRVDNVFAGNKNLASKPLFFARVVALLQRDSEFSGGDDLLSELTHRYLERELNEKLLNRQQQPLLSKGHLEQLMGELAEEMWNQETRELDSRSVQEVAEYVLDDKKTPESTRQIVAERMPTLAFLAHSEKHTGIMFEHEVFFFYFLTRSIVHQYVQGMTMQVILSRSTLPEFVAERLAFELHQGGYLSTLDNLQKIFDRLAEAGRTEWNRKGQVRENAGIIILALLRKFKDTNSASPEITGCTISTAVFPGSNLDGVTLRNCTLSNVEFRRTNLETTKFIKCNARDVRLVGPRVNIKSTRLELNGLRVPEDVPSIHELSYYGNSMIYAPSEITHVLDKCGASVEKNSDEEIREVSKKFLELLEKLIRAYQRANPICISDGASPHLQRLLRDPLWPTLRDLLIRHGIVKQEYRGTSGPRKEFLRRQFSPDEIMLGMSKTSRVDPRIARFWDDLEGEAV